MAGVVEPPKARAVTRADAGGGPAPTSHVAPSDDRPTKPAPTSTARPPPLASANPGSSWACVNGMGCWLQARPSGDVNEAQSRGWLVAGSCATWPIATNRGPSTVIRSKVSPMRSWLSLGSQLEGSRVSVQVAWAVVAARGAQAASAGVAVHMNIAATRAAMAAELMAARATCLDVMRW